MKKNVIRTTTAELLNMGIDKFAGYDSEFVTEAYEIIGEIDNDSPEQWASIMMDDDGKFYAVWAEGALTCQYCDAAYVEIQESDCPAAFQAAKDKIIQEKHDRGEF